MIEEMVSGAIRAFDGDAHTALEAFGGQQSVVLSFGRTTPIPGLAAVERAHGLEPVSVAAQEDLTAVTAEHPGRYSYRVRDLARGPAHDKDEAELGRGGIGRVLIAFDDHLGREVAIKELLPQRGQSSDPNPSMQELSSVVVRFLREARVTGQLEHPNIIPVYELGRRRDGSLYYAMKLVRGRTLSSALKDCRGLGDRLKLLTHFSDLCHAVSYAHSRGVIHRDLKPDNVMLGEFGETLVLDWGLAKARGKADLRSVDLQKELLLLRKLDSGKTEAGEIMGTPLYMSPEQAAGEIDAIDERSDVWSLGAVLYELLTGRPPFEGATVFAVLSKVLKDPHSPACGVCPELPPELGAIAEKALQKDQAARYPDARAMAEEVQSFLTGGRVRAYAYSAWELVTRLVIHHRAAALAAGVAVLAIVAALVAVSLALGREQAERRLAAYHLVEAYAEKADGLAERQDLPAALVYGTAALLHNPAHPGSPQHHPAFVGAHPESHALRLRTAERVAAWRRAFRTELVRTLDLGGTPTRLALSRDERRLAVPLRQRAIEVWTLDAVSAPRVLQGHRAEVVWAGFSPDGRTLASSSLDETLALWDLERGERLAVHEGHAGRALACDLSPDGSLVAQSGRDGSLGLVERLTGKLRRTLPGNGAQIQSLDYSPDGRRLAAADEDGRVRVYDVSLGSLERELSALDTSLFAVRFSEDGQLLAAGGYLGQIALWDAESGKLTRTIAAHSNLVHALSFSRDSRWLASTSADGTVALWSVADGACLARFRAHTDAVVDAVFLSDGRTLVTAGRDIRVRFWRLAAARPLPSLAGHSERIYALRVSPDGRLLATGGWDRRALVWSLPATEGARPALSLEGHQDSIYGLEFDPTSTRVATACLDGVVRLYDAHGGRLLHALEGHRESVHGVSFSPDGARLVSASWDGSLRIWGVDTGQELRVITAGGGRVYQALFSPDGHLLASAWADGALRLWDASSGLLIRTQQAHTGRVTGLAFSPSGRELVSSGEDAQVVLWDTATGREIRRFQGHARWVNNAFLSRDGRLLATASDDGEVRLWEFASGRLLRIIGTRTEAVGVDFLPDGRTLAVSDFDRVILYPMELEELARDPVELLQEAERRAGRTLEGFSLRFAKPTSR